MTTQTPSSQVPTALVPYVIHLLGPIINPVARGMSIALRTKTGRVGAFIVLIHLVLVFFGPFLVTHDTTKMNVKHRLEGPSATYWLGTDHYGRDVFSRTVAGARSIVWIATAGTFLGISMGTSVGIISAYKGGTTDQVLMRGADILLAFPGLLLTLLLLDLGVHRFNVGEEYIIVWAIGFGNLPIVSRVIRSATLSIKEQEFVQNARLRGESNLAIVYREILPNVMPIVLVEASLRIGFALLAIGGLGFLGLGVQPPNPDWGLMVSESRKWIAMSAWQAITPAFAMASLIVGLNLLADGIRQAMQIPVDKPPN